MTDWSRLETIFADALALPPPERPAFVDKAAQDSPALRTELMSLLDAHERATGFLEPPLAVLEGDATEPQSLVGQQVGPYAVQAELGRGGAGIVYLAEDTRLHRLVALKALLPHVAAKPTARERLTREAQAAAAAGHAAIATVYALDEIDGALYLVSEYVSGRTLRAELAGGPLSPQAVVRTAVEIAAALEAAHAIGVVHRDLKPENVMRTADGRIKILDFGLAHLDEMQSPPLTQDGAVFGTPAYMSPEQIRGEAVDFRSDLFSFGVLLYELATGRHPFQTTHPVATLASVLERQPAPLAEILGAATPPGLDAIVVRCLEKRRERRYASTSELVNELNLVASRLLIGPEITGRDASTVREADRPASDKPSSVVTSRGAPSHAWWELHQALVAGIDALMLYPVWSTRHWMPAGLGVAFLVLVLAPVVAAVSLRLHLLFTARVYNNQLTDEHAHVSRWLRRTDTALSVLFAAGGLLCLAISHEAIAILFLTFAVGSFVAFTVIEPATTRASIRK
jgi:serine/threonine protein kinase